MWKTTDGSTGRLLQLCLGYFSLYVLFGLASKYFPASVENGFPGVPRVAFLVYTTLGGSALAVSVVLSRRWYRMRATRTVRWGSLEFPAEYLYIVPSGICTAVVIPTTTMMYMLPISVMVAMVIMRGSVIVISRIVDAIQIQRGLLDKKVYWEENVAVVFAVGAVAVNVVAAQPGDFDFVRNTTAMTILSSYVTAYAIRIYIMNYYKNTRGKGKRLNNKAFFAVEQLAASSTIVLVALTAFAVPHLFGNARFVAEYRDAFLHPHSAWPGSLVSGMIFGVVAFFSVFLFMFKGRTATFAGLVNRLTSLVAGTVSTLLFAFGWGGRFPSGKDWSALLMILIAVAFLTRSERKRMAELKARHELENAD